MAIGTSNGQLAVLRFDQNWEINAAFFGVFDQGMQQMLLWNYSELLWGAAYIPPGGTGTAVYGALPADCGRERVSQGVIRMGRKEY